IGNDTLTSKSLTLSDSIYTDGGADTIILPAGHLGADHIGFYAADMKLAATPALLGSVAGCISENSGGGACVLSGGGGGRGGGAGGSARGIIGGGLFGGVASGSGTSADASQLFGFVPLQDILDFSAKAWTGGLGLTADQNGTLVNVGAAGLASDLGTAASMAGVGPGGGINGMGGTDDF